MEDVLLFGNVNSVSQPFKRTQIESEGVVTVYLKPWLAGLGNRVRSRRKNARKNIQARSETLESRTLLTVTALLSNATELTIVSDRDDAITVQADLNGDVQILDDGAVLPFGLVPANSLTKLEVFGGDSENTIDVSNVTSGVFTSLLSIELDGGDGNDMLIGSNDFGDLIGGNDGNDTIIGGGGDDTLDGDDGDDSIIGGTGNDSLKGGDGADEILGELGLDTIAAGNGDDVIDGGLEADSIDGGQGDDNIIGNDGDDNIMGGSGNDIIAGGLGADVIVAGAGNDSVDGNDGDDQLSGDSGNDTINGGVGDDDIFGGADNDTLNGNNGNDSILGDSGADSIEGEAGADTIFAGGGNDFANGGLDDDIVSGNSGADTLVGGLGMDNLRGGNGDDLVMSVLPGTVIVAPPVGISISDVPTIVEGDTGTTQAVFTVSLSATSTSPVSVLASTTDGSALAGSDYSAVNQTVTIPAGQLSATVPVDVIGETLSELEENFFVELSGAVNGVITDSFGVGTILDDADGPTQVVFVDFDSQTDPGEHVYTQAERDAIVARMQFDYRFFNTTIQQTAPLTGPFATLFINQPPTGGLASEIDFRNLNLNTSASIDINGIIPAASPSSDFIGITATIAAHELGHTMGLRHNDSFGPIGSGISTVVIQPTDFLPAYPGPTGATETGRNISSSPGSTGQTVAEAIMETQFSVRASVKLATWAYEAQITAESTNAHDTIATAQPITLDDLTVPNSRTFGAFSAGEIFDVDASIVTGDITVGGEVDLYEFNATAGQLLNLEVISDLIVNSVDPSDTPRFPDPIDSQVRILDTAGNPIPYYTGTAVNQDGTDSRFPDSDSILIDLIIPADGTYYVEVSAEAAADTGGYELYMYTFATTTAFTPTQTGVPTVPTAIVELGDTLNGESGRDTMIGEEGNDLLIGDDGRDSLVGNGGDDTFFGGAARDTLVGGVGNDVLDGQSGNDVLDGGEGANQIIFNGLGSGVDVVVDSIGSQSVVVNTSNQANTITLQQSSGQLQIAEGSDSITTNDTVNSVVINSNDGDDTINIQTLSSVRLLNIAVNAGAGNDTITGTGADVGLLRIQMNGEAGNDVINGTLGKDIIDGGDDDDLINGANGDDTITGGNGNDVLNGEGNNDNIDGGIGNDTISGGDGNDTAQGGFGDDFVNGDAGNDDVRGGQGDDIVVGSFGRDLVQGGIGNDSLFGGTGADSLDGGNGSDFIRGHSGSDQIKGGDGNDEITGDAGNDIINGGDGNDIISDSRGLNTIAGGDGDDVIIGGNDSDTVIAGDGNDTVYGGGGRDVIFGQDGDDLLLGNGGGDKFNSGEGSDVLGDQGANEVDNEMLTIAMSIQLALDALTF